MAIRRVARDRRETGCSSAAVMPIAIPMMRSGNRAADAAFSQHLPRWEGGKRHRDRVIPLESGFCAQSGRKRCFADLRFFIAGNIEVFGKLFMLPIPQPESPPSPGRKKSGRILELDAIRALTCLNLLFFHLTYVYAHKYGFSSEIGVTFPYGKYGVQLFFMLSGLVNALTLVKKRRPGDFIVSRCIRIFPSYWLVILLNVVLLSTLTMFQHDLTVGEVIANLTALPQLFGYPNMEPVTWTLQVEMLFYLFLMTIFSLGLLDRPLPTMMVSMGVCLAACGLFDWYQNVAPESHWNGVFHVVEELFLLRTLPLFAMGILLNEVRCGRGRAWQHWLGIAVCGVVFHWIDLRDHNPLATVLMMGLLTAAAHGKIPVLRFRPLIFIGFISYPLYLFHNNLGSALMKWLESQGLSAWPTVIIATLFSIGLATAVTYGFEQPLTRRLRKWIGGASRKPEPDPTPAGNNAPDTSRNPSPRQSPLEFDSSECLEDVIQAEELVQEIRRQSSEAGPAWRS